MDIDKILRSEVEVGGGCQDVDAEMPAKHEEVFLLFNYLLSKSSRKPVVRNIPTCTRI